MFKTILLIFVLVSVNCIQQRSQKQNHQVGKVSEQCCNQKKGKMCGRFLKDCCQGECAKSYGGIYCSGGDQKIIKEGCSNTCIQQCQKNQGHICSTGFFGEFQCCKKQDCVGTITTRCKKDKIINLPGCIEDSGTQKAGNIITGFFKSIFSS